MRWLWRLIGLLALAAELLALRNRRAGDSFSEVIWRWEEKHPLVWWLVAAFLAWLSIHLLMRGRWDRFYMRLQPWGNAEFTARLQAPEGEISDEDSHRVRFGSRGWLSGHP